MYEHCDFVCIFEMNRVNFPSYQSNAMHTHVCKYAFDTNFCIIFVCNTVASAMDALAGCASAGKRPLHKSVTGTRFPVYLQEAGISVL